LLHLQSDLFKVGSIQQPFADRRLVGNYDQRWPQRRELSKRIADAGHKNELRPVQNVVAGPPAIDHAVAVNEDGRAFCSIL